MYSLSINDISITNLNNCISNTNLSIIAQRLVSSEVYLINIIQAIAATKKYFYAMYISLLFYLYKYTNHKIICIANYFLLTGFK